MATRPHILIVEDEASIADTIVYALASNGFDPHWCNTAEQALQHCLKQAPNLAILDVGLPDLNGFELLRALRAQPKLAHLPIIFLTARSDEIDRVVGLELGADDYVAKPFSPRELSARVRTILRRTSDPLGTSLDVHKDSAPPAFVIDEDRQTIHYYGHLLDLTRYEYGVLKTLVKRPGRVFSREELLSLVWINESESYDRTVDAHIKTLRAKMRTLVPNHDPIRTLRGSGYALNESPPRSS